LKSIYLFVIIDITFYGLYVDNTHVDDEKEAFEKQELRLDFFLVTLFKLISTTHKA